MLWTSWTTLWRWGLALTVALAVCPPCQAQELPVFPDDRCRDLILPRDLADWTNRNDAPFSERSKDRFRLFCMPTAFPSNPLALDIDNDAAIVDVSPAAGGSGDVSFPGNRIQLSLGVDNPYFDFRRPGDPGGIGFYRLNSQYTILDSQWAGLGLGLQAFTPAGLDADGVGDGPTVLSPNLACFCQSSNGTALQAFVGKNLRTRPGWTGSLHRGIEYGLALQSPLSAVAGTANQNMHLFLEALGRYRFDTEPYQRPPSLHVVPGVHWQLNDAWWISGGLLMPRGSLENRLWQITCSWHF